MYKNVVWVTIKIHNDSFYTSRFTYELTDMCVISVCAPTSLDVRPLDFNSMAGTAKHTEGMALAMA
ncbi:hypothetical protein [Prevotella fusca]|uniref:Uncharacterized protein n=1 Tax=Prevotella fusca JCM 17724 TaxID=1236517 RepID=A0A0K1NL89_9BACT|nr:hypothetical protein [Prevotella fusca]AKU69849.1 hypothetical protein ADJ77_08250 [Prevotella fusca JCM 17724]